MVLVRELNGSGSGIGSAMGVGGEGGTWVLFRGMCGHCPVTSLVTVSGGTALEGEEDYPEVKTGLL